MVVHFTVHTRYIWLTHILCYFILEDDSWSQPDVSGSPPCARHGHVSVVVGTDIYIHGGMAGTNMFDDVYKFNTGRLYKL